MAAARGPSPAIGRVEFAVVAVATETDKERADAVGLLLLEPRAAGDTAALATAVVAPVTA